jgi:hypothetical protein
VDALDDMDDASRVSSIHVVIAMQSPGDLRGKPTASNRPGRTILLVAAALACL